jgi:hypothetical protein
LESAASELFRFQTEERPKKKAGPLFYGGLALKMYLKNRNLRRETRPASEPFLEQAEERRTKKAGPLIFGGTGLKDCLKK